jgi:hypothetical protein
MWGLRYMRSGVDGFAGFGAEAMRPFPRLLGVNRGIGENSGFVR